TTTEIFTLSLHDALPIFAKQKLVGNTDTFLILSDEQTKGKGRFNRPWDSSRGKGLWMSIVLRPKVPFEMITKFNLFMALGIRDTDRKSTRLNSSHVSISY